MKDYNCNNEVIITERQKQELRCKFLEKKTEVMTMFGFQRTCNLAMLYGELNVLIGIGVYSEEIGEKMRKQIMELM